MKWSLASVVYVIVGIAACRSPDEAIEGGIVPSPLPAVAVLTDVNSDPGIVEVQLVATTSTMEYLAGKRTAVWAYRDGAVAGSAGIVPGPLLRAKVGDQIIVHFRNELPDDTPTTVHWHGVRLPPEYDGAHDNLHLHPGESFDYRFVAQDAGTFWYHPHAESFDQIERGLYGPIVIDGGTTPEVAADRTFVLDDVKLAAGGALSEQISDSDRMFGRQGNMTLVNGVAAPARVAIPAGARERWRFINAANGRFFNLHLPGARFLVIGGDGGLLPEPYQAESLLIVPGERYEVLVTLDGEPGTNGSLEMIPYDRGGGVGASDRGTLLQVIHGARTVASLELPKTWREIAPLPVAADTPVRRFSLGELSLPGGALLFSIDGQVWPDGAPVRVKRGVLEIWAIENPMPMDHPVHLHGMFFQVLDDGHGTRPPLGWKDTVDVPGRSIMRFAVTPDPLGVWMFHCHILEHAAAGMMINVVVEE